MFDWKMIAQKAFTIVAAVIGTGCFVGHCHADEVSLIKQGQPIACVVADSRNTTAAGARCLTKRHDGSSNRCSRLAALHCRFWPRRTIVPRW